MGHNHKRRARAIPWPEIKADFVRGMSCSQCAEKHGVSVFTIQSKSKRERWSAERQPGLKPPVGQQVSSDIDSGLVEIAMRSVEQNLVRAGDSSLPDIERRRCALIAKTAASTLKDLTSARERQARMSRAAIAEEQQADVASVIRVVIPDQRIPTVEGRIPGYFGPDNITADEKWAWMREHYDERGNYSFNGIKENNNAPPPASL